MGEVHEGRFQAVLDNLSLADPDHPDVGWEKEIEEQLRRREPVPAPA